MNSLLALRRLRYRLASPQGLKVLRSHRGTVAVVYSAGRRRFQPTQSCEQSRLDDDHLHVLADSRGCHITELPFTRYV